MAAYWVTWLLYASGHKGLRRVVILFTLLGVVGCVLVINSDNVEVEQVIDGEDTDILAPVKKVIKK